MRFQAGWLSSSRALGASIEEQFTSVPGTTPASWCDRTKLGRQLAAWISFPHYLSGWQRTAVTAANSLMKQHKFDVILSTSPPRTAHLIANEIARRHGVPWIMDLRDPWYGEWAAEYTDSRLLKSMYHKLYVRCAKQATIVVANTERLRSQLQLSVPERAEHVVTIPNGCPAASDARSSHSRKSQKFSIGHYGNLYERRTAATFVHGLRLWMDRNHPSRTSISVKFTGKTSTATCKSIAHYDMLDTIQLCPSVSRGQVRNLMLEDYVLLVIANDQPYQLPGKVYEYLSVGRRILAITEHDSTTADILKDRAGCAIAETPDQVATALQRFWQDFQRGKSAEIDHSEFVNASCYGRRTEQLAAVIKEACTSRNRDRSLTNRRARIEMPADNW